MKVRPTILEYYDKLNSVCSFWRGRGPLSELSRQDKVKIVESNWKHDWSIMRLFDIAFFQRPVHKNCLDQVLMCKDLGLKIWVDLDDWMHIPERHSMFTEYNKNFDELSFKKILLCADVVTVTNERLKESFIEYLKDIKDKIEVVPNALNDQVYSIKPISQNKSILYRGGEVHRYDMDEYQNEISRFLIKNSDWMFYAIGHDVKRLRKLDNYQYLGGFGIHEYMSLISNINPSVMVVPLSDNKFNRNKSNISWIEGTMSGAACVSPDYFTDSISLKYNSKSSFSEALSEITYDEKLRCDLYLLSKEIIERDLLLSKVNEQRIQIIKNIL